MGSVSSPHFAIFPFMSQGHTIPLLHLSRLLRRRSAAVTIFTTAKNSPSIRKTLQNVDVSIIELPFPQNINGVPPGIENTHELPSMSCFIPFVNSTKQMQKSFEQSLETLKPPVSCIISDGFLGWTVQSAKKMGIPRFVSFGMSVFSCTLYQILGTERPHKETKSLSEQFSIPDFPHLKLTRNDFEPPFNEIEPCGPFVDFMVEQNAAVSMSYGVIVNSYYELESVYVDYWNKKIGPKAFCIGPLCINNAEPIEKTPNSYTQFLDEKLDKNEPVLYVSFGTQAEVSDEQLVEIAKGLENSKVSFLWALKSIGLGLESLLPGFEFRVKDRGLVVHEWVDQQRILRHEGVKGILSHCGWNSVTESVSAGVPIVAMPFMAEQHLNARFVVEEIEVGVRIVPRDGSMRGFVEAEEVERKVREVMGDSENAVEVRRKVAEYGKAACDAMKEGGSSWRTLNLLIDDVSRKETVTLSCSQ